jgi:hypothetical protein
MNGDGGKDILKANAGKDALSGPPTDGFIDSLDGGADPDTCQGPGTDHDVLVSCNP